jgi:hypothetical protein
MDIFGNNPEHTLHALFIGYGSIGIAIGLAVLMTNDSNKEKRTVELFCSLIIAFATIALVWVTYKNLSESEELRKSSQDMTNATRRMAELYEDSVKQMIKQSNIQMQSNVIALMPILDVDIKLNHKDNPNKYNIILHNKGKGPANVFFCLLNIQPSKIPQIMALTEAQLNARTYTVTVGALGSGESKILRTGSDIAYKCITIEIGLMDLFEKKRKWVFEGEPNGFRLVDFPSLVDFEENN